MLVGRLDCSMPPATSDPADQWKKKWTPNNLCVLCLKWNCPSEFIPESVLSHVKSCPFGIKEHIDQMTEDMGAVFAGKNLDTVRVVDRDNLTPGSSVFSMAASDVYSHVSCSAKQDRPSVES